MNSTSTPFYQNLFWIIGTSCTYWMSTVFISAVRFNSATLPVLGVCSQMEANVFTLLSMWAPLLLLHFCLHKFQTNIHAQEEAAAPFFPGAFGEHIIPKDLKFLRLLLFIVLMAWPTVLYGFLTGRALDHFRIVPSGDVATSMTQGRYLAGADLLGFPFKLPSQSKPEDAFWWVNAERTELDSSGSRTKITAAWPEALGFVLMSTILGISLLMSLVNGFAKGGTRGLWGRLRSRKR